MNDQIPILIAEGNTASALNSLLSILKELDSDLYEEALIISNTYKNFERKKLSGIISETEEALIQNKINYSILELAKLNPNKSILSTETNSIKKSKSNQRRFLIGGLFLISIPIVVLILLRQIIPSYENTGEELNTIPSVMDLKVVLSGMETENDLSGILELKIRDGRKLMEVVDQDGLVSFKDIPNMKVGDTVKFRLLNSNLSLKQQDSMIVIHNEVLNLSILKPSTKKKSEPPYKYEVNGRVLDQYGKPLPSALVRVDSQITTTDERGNFSIPVEGVDQNIRIEVSKEGYKSDWFRVHPLSGYIKFKLKKLDSES